MEKYELCSHPAYPPAGVRAITASLSVADPHWIKLRWRIEGARSIVVPRLAGRKRADGLWQTTCLELFLAAENGTSGTYLEYNFSPSENWAAYEFAGYREKAADLPVPRPPVIDWRGSGDLAIVDVALPREPSAVLPWNFGLTAVIEEDGGVKSFWAIVHPAGDAPDFHAPACFAGRVGAPAGI